MPFENRLTMKESEAKRKLARQNAARKLRTGLDWMKHTPGPKGMRNDCAVRAITLALGISYTKVYEEIQRRNTLIGKSLGKRCNDIHKGGTLNVVSDKYLKENGWLPVEFDKKLLKASDLPVQPCIVRVSGHMVYVEDNTILDTWDCRGKRSRRIETIYVPQSRLVEFLEV